MPLTIEERRQHRVESDRRYRRKHAEKHRASVRDWQARNRGKVKTYAKKAYLKKKYGLSPAELRAMTEQQGRKCAVCRLRPATHVDHDHETGRVRAVLCHKCNTALGLMDDNLSILQRAASYVMLHHRKRVKSSLTSE